MPRPSRKQSAAKNDKKVAKADFKQAFQEEIARLARKAGKEPFQKIHEQLAALKKLVAAQNARIKALEAGKPAPAAKAPGLAAAAEAGSGKAIRLNAARIIAIREKHNLNQVQFAKVLGVSNFSVNHWELGKSTPRLAAKKAIAALRSMGKKEFAALCASKGVTPGKRVRKAAAKKAKAAAPVAPVAAEPVKK